MGSSSAVPPHGGGGGGAQAASTVSSTQVAALVYNYLRSNGFFKAMKQFKEDADPLLAPFKNRIPAGVKALDAVLNEYVMLKPWNGDPGLEEREGRRAAAAANDPLAARLYRVMAGVN